MFYITKLYRDIFEGRTVYEAIIYVFWYVLHRLLRLSVMRICFLTLNHNLMQEFKIGSCEVLKQFEFKKIFPHELKMYDYNKVRITSDDIDNGIKNGDMLYVVLLQETHKIVSYGWYSFRPTMINKHCLLTFPQDYIYMYNGYTEPDYRGSRLHALGMQYACLDALKLGRKGLVSFVNIENYRSIRSCKRIGYRFTGFIAVYYFLSKDYIFISPKIKALSINLQKNLWRMLQTS